MEYQDKTVVVTGAGSGLGAAIADAFAGAGARLALLDIDAERAHAKAADLAARGTEAIAIGVDVADKASVAAAAQAVASRLGGCDVLCANVGVQQFGAVDRLSDEDWTWVLSVNVRGVIDTVSAFLPLLRHREGLRHIVLTASSSYFTPGVRMAAYVTSKYAVVGYGEVLRMELAEEDINVALLFPAGMATRHLESSVRARPAALGPSRLDRDDIRAMMASAKMSPEKDVATPEHAVRNLLADLRTRQPYIITHGGYRDQIEARNTRVLEAFGRMESRP
ncbi:SDR family NAD(P)-dependent oxidoreductase [Sinimarinibacterium flocculans]|uniref:SDR family NAD(P)-dependent oxidoreductase n=1 Tax=Sinimarinibacterium flocculans TaxID=985250 RepID=UPI003518636D